MTQLVQGPEETWAATRPPSSGASDGTEATVASGTKLGSALGSGQPVERFTRGSLLGRYLILERLGAGAMGVVFAAYDPELDRRVALKVLASRGAPGQDTSSGRARMQREAQAMARLSHPNVVAVFDVGDYRDEVFIAMELVEGQSLKAWLAKVGRSRQEILRVFLAAAHGLHAAHQAGVVHRDFKPDNVMVDSSSRAKVMDFGLARPELARGATATLAAQSATGMEPTVELTATGAVVGTPAYMAPEQFEGQPAEAATDQFAFCVALWEALSGERPFRGRSFTELAAQVCGDAPLPAVATSKMPPHVRSALTRGLRRGAAQRYPDMASLIAALESDPVPRRRRIFGIALLPSLVGVVLVGGVVAQNVEDAKCEKASQRLRQHWEQTLMPRARDGIGAVLSRAGLDEQLWPSTAASVERFLSAWESADADLCAGRGSFADHVLEADLKRLEKARECLDERADALDAMGEVLQAQDVLTAVAAPALADRLPTIEDCTDRATLASRPLLPTNQSTQAEVRALRRDIFAGLAKRLGGSLVGLRVQAEAVAARANALGWAPIENEAMVALAHAQAATGAAFDAERSFSRAYYESARLADDRLAAEAATALTSLVTNELGRPEDGAFWLGLATEATQRSTGDTSLPRATLLMAAASVDYRNGDYEGGVGRLEEALEIRRRIYGDEHPSTAGVRTTLGIYLRDVGQNDRARLELNRALEIYSRVYGSKHPETARTLSALGTLSFLAKDYATARARYLEAVQAWEESVGAEHPDLAIGLNNLASAHWALGDYDLAIAQYQRANTLVERAFGSPHPDLAMGQDNLGLALYASDRPREALASFDLSLAGWLELDMRETISCSDTYLHRARVQAQLEMWAQARESAALASAIHARVLGPSDPRVGLDQLELARNSRRLSQLTEARVAAQISVEILAAAGTEADALQEAKALIVAIDAGSPLPATASGTSLLPSLNPSDLSSWFGADHREKKSPAEKREKAKVRDKTHGGSSSASGDLDGDF